MSSKEQLLDELRINRAAPIEEGGSGLRVVIAALSALILGVAGTWWWLREEPALSVTTAVVTSSASAPTADSVLDATGYVTARRQATVSSEVTGKVTEVLIEEGMVVEEGQLLARLDDSLLQATLNLSQAQLEAAERNVAEIKVQLKEAQQALTRSTELRSRGLVSEQALENATAAVDGLEARLSSAKQAIVVADRTVAIQQEQLDNTLIRAPFSGVVINKAAQPGEMISPVSAGGGFTRTGICTIVDMQSLEIEVDVNESYINRVQAGQPVAATLNSYPDWKIPAEVITIIPAADRNRATVSVRIALLEKDARVLPDMGAKVAFLTDEQAPTATADVDALLVPDSAVMQSNGISIVYVIANGAAQRRVIEADSASLGGQRRVQSGLRGGDRVVLNLDDALAQQLESDISLQIAN